MQSAHKMRMLLECSQKPWNRQLLQIWEWQSVYLNERHQEWEKLKAHLSNTLDGSQIECCCLECQMGSWNTINNDLVNKTLMVHRNQDSRMSFVGTQGEVKEKMFYSPNCIIWNICYIFPHSLNYSCILFAQSYTLLSCMPNCLGKMASNGNLKWSWVCFTLLETIHCVCINWKILITKF
jgi:hypothetical protein